MSLAVADDPDAVATFWMHGEQAGALPADGAREALLKLAQVFLTAAYRLDVIGAAEESTTSDKVAYRIDFGPELLPLTPETLLRLKPAEGVPEVAPVEASAPRRAAEDRAWAGSVASSPA